MHVQVDLDMLSLAQNWLRHTESMSGNGAHLGCHLAQRRILEARQHVEHKINIGVRFFLCTRVMEPIGCRQNKMLGSEVG